MGLGKGLALSAVVVARVTRSDVEAPARLWSTDRKLSGAGGEGRGFGEGAVAPSHEMRCA